MGKSFWGGGGICGVGGQYVGWGGGICGVGGGGVYVWGHPGSMQPMQEGTVQYSIG